MIQRISFHQQQWGVGVGMVVVVLYTIVFKTEYQYESSMSALWARAGDGEYVAPYYLFIMPEKV